MPDNPMSAELKEIQAKQLEHRIREHFYEPLGRKKIADTYRYLAGFATSETCMVWLNLAADRIEGKA